MSQAINASNRAIAALAEQRASLELGTLDLCFIALLRLRSKAANIPALSEQQLFDAFEQVCNAVEPATENVKARATHAIRRLREQRLLARVDGQGILRPGEFALSGLATAIADFYVSSNSLTSENLTLLSRTLMLSLSEILATAKHAATEETWRVGVAAPLQVTVSDLVTGIEARQRSLDLEQEALQRQIAMLLNADWFGAIEQCQELLETTATTLHELNTILLRGTHEMSALLQDLLSLALEAKNTEAEHAVNQVIDQVDQVGAWGAMRQRAWSEYYDYVHRYLQDVVRFDPSRAMSQRLRQLLTDPPERMFSLVVASAPPLRVLREVTPPEAPPPVRRRKKPTAEQPAIEIAQPDPVAFLQERVRALLDEGVTDLADLTARLTTQVPESERFLVAGRVANALATLKRPLSSRERPWIAIDEHLAIEQWRLADKRGTR